MNSLPNDIILKEIFPRMKLSKIFDLTIAYPPLLPLVKTYILELGKELNPQDSLTNHKDVLKNLLHSENIQTRFMYIKNYIPVLLYLHTIGVGSKLDEIESYFSPKLDQLEKDFMDELNQHLDVIFEKTIVNPRSLIYALKNKPSMGLQNVHDFRILEMFPSFTSKIEKLIQSYYSPCDHIIKDIKTELNLQMYQCIVDPLQSNIGI